MNSPGSAPVPPPLPETPGRAAARRAAWLGLLASLLAMLIGAVGVLLALKSKSSAIPIIASGAGLLLVMAGLIMGILGLCGVREHGPRGILGAGTTAVTINSLLLILIFTGLTLELNNKILKRSQYEQEVRGTVQDIQAKAKRSFNPRTGITNVDFNGLDRLQTQFNYAAQTLSGDDARIAQVMAAHVARLETAMKKYDAAATALRKARVLDLSGLDDEKQIAARRQIVQDFLVANDNVKSVVSNSEANIRADLIRLEVAPARQEITLDAFHSKAAPRSVLILRIRACDDQIGQSTLTILSSLETQWGKWHYDPVTKTVRFQDAETQYSYRQALGEIKLAGYEQIATQRELLNLQ
ncbi:MAG TPA: hypothetical protein VMA35_05365 [Candidatus Sulfopaludibacter sp.]|nr:hypothetical protein [Candidatus Sulfopaludibacter sp.]